MTPATAAGESTRHDHYFEGASLEKLYSYAWKLAHQNHREIGPDAGDLVQAAIGQAWRLRNSVEITSTFHSWAYTVMRDAMRDTNKAWKWGASAVQTDRGYLHSMQGLTTFDDGESDKSRSVPAVSDDLSAVEMESLLGDLSEEDVRVVQLMMDGYEDQEIERMLGLTRSNVYERRQRMIRMLGLERPTVAAPKPKDTSGKYASKLTDADRDEIVRLYAKGSTAVALGELFGCSDVAVRKVLKSRNVELRPRRKHS